jgi:hypothetical protein
VKSAQTLSLKPPALIKRDYCLYSYGESFLSRFYQFYPAAETYLRRARFYAGAIELRWVLQGIERKDPMWLTAHIGCAKDMKFNP